MAEKTEKKNKKGNGFGITSLIFGVLSLFFVKLFPPLGIFFGIFGIIFGIVQKRRTPTDLATAGLITSIIGLILSIFFLILYFMAFYLAKEFAMDLVTQINESISNLPFNQLNTSQNLPPELLDKIK